MAQKSCLFVQNYSRFGDWVDEFVAGIIEMRFLQGTSFQTLTIRN
jgi:hypothetical protein